MASIRGDMVSVFVLPPSMAELERRLRSRAQDSEEVVRGRMAKASDEMSHWAEYDYVILNEDIEASIDTVLKLLAVERLKHDRQPGLADFVNRLRSGG
jgi:guanylate kinase